MTGFALHLLRHGEVETPGRLMGRTDATPTAAGIAHCVAQARDLGVAVLITSDLARARLAGDAIGNAVTLVPVVDPGWRELDFGAWDGLLPAQIDRAALGQFWDDPDANPPPGGERWSALRARVAAAIHDLAPVPTLVVSHGGAIRAALAVLCGFDHRQIWAFDLPCGALVSLRVWPGVPIAAQATAQATAQIAGLYP